MDSRRGGAHKRLLLASHAGCVESDRHGGWHRLVAALARSRHRNSEPMSRVCRSPPGRPDLLARATVLEPPRATAAEKALDSCIRGEAGGKRVSEASPSLRAG